MRVFETPILHTPLWQSHVRLHFYIHLRWNALEGRGKEAWATYFESGLCLEAGL